MGLLIRRERPGDYAEIYRLVCDAFGRDAEARLVEALRASSAFIAELSLVAEREGEVVGHILFTHIAVSDGPSTHPALALAPLAVLPPAQRKGVGTALVKHGLEEARRLGHGLVIVLGHPGYYPKFGFTPARRFGIRPPFDASERAFMVLGLGPDALGGVRGTVEYPREFDLCSRRSESGK